MTALIRPENAVAPPPTLDAPVRFTAGRHDLSSQASVDDLAAHWRRFGAIPREGWSLGLLESLDAVELTGRGGGHFPVAAKWRAVRSALGPSVVVANGAEGEPLSRKDEALLRLRPHLVLDGLAVAAHSLGANDAVIWLHRGATGSVEAVARAITARRAAGLPGPPMRIVTGPDHYLSGESSAVISALNGGSALPAFRRTHVAIDGVGGRPTLVQNIETLAHVGRLARLGAQYRPDVLLTVADGEQLTVVSSGQGRSLRSVVAETVGWARYIAPSAALVGGYGGTWSAWDEVADLALTPSAFAAAGLSLGAGIIRPLAPQVCGVAAMAAMVSHLADASARQCGPCLFGLRALAGLVEDIAECHVGVRQRARAQRFLAEIDGRGACRHPDGAVRMVRSGMQVFHADARSHILWHRCIAGGR